MSKNVYVNERIIYLSDSIDMESVGITNFTLMKLIEEDDKQDKEKKDFKREPIKLYIDTFGGQLYPTWSLITTILNSKTPIYTYTTGCAISAGFIIFLAGHKRYMGKYATLMYHQLSSGCIDTMIEIKDSHEQNIIDQMQMENYVLERTGITQEKIDEIRERQKDWYIKPNEALELKIIDEII